MISPGGLDSVAGRFKGEVSLESEIIPVLLALKSEIYGFRHDGRFIDIGVPADYRRAADILGAIKSRDGFER
jgi:D-glycero-alpha-D-manno-heptose 1-phosphate guanylyltransferase